ncbi:MAG TPA: TonB-dependent receptor [Rhodanobacteraceae bacterium]|nr:TonB-dependent receptor [Rhodanobacteraceae bacterium]
MNRKILVTAICGSLLAAGTAYAQGSPAPQNAQGNTQNNTPQTLQTIVVTGSHIRRVDVETSNPVVAVTAQQIAATGKTTLGDVVQNLPVITGSLSNPNVNNSGGSGATFVGLRGLGASRTLVLIDGQRLLSQVTGTQSLQDLNFIPAAAVERIEVLTDGASAVYGSDAIGGVINVILKTNYQGAQFTTNYGTSDRNDGQRKGGSFMFGQTSDKGSILAGVEYNQFDEVLASQRKFSQNSVSLTTSNGVPVGVIGGSSYAARDRISFVDPTIAPAFGGGAGCGFLSLNESAAAAGTSPTGASDYHCFGNADKYNYASVNLLMTPVEHTNAFFKGTYHLTDNIDFFGTYLHQKTSSAFQLAPAVFGTSTGVTISKDNYYNPFGVDFTPSNGNDFRVRMFPAGNRSARLGTTSDQLNIGLRGNVTIFDQNWTWDAGYNYGHYSRTSTVLGLPNQAALEPGLGPSFLNASTGQVECGTATSPVPNCTPWDPFNMFNPATEAVVGASSAPSIINTWAVFRTYHAGISGGLFDLPAGTAQLAAGVSYNKQYTNNTVGPSLLIEEQPPYSCPLGSQCSAHLQGGYSDKEAYAELFVPILKDMPLVRELNVTLGDRFSKYNTVGSTNNWKVAIEYRPIDDLLLRGTTTSVFRAPNIGQIFGSPVSSAPYLAVDPCDGFTGAPAGSGPALACRNVPTNGTFKDSYVAFHQQLTSVTSGSQFFGINLKPESGKTFDFGAVYSPHYVPGLSLSADIWRVYLNNTITTVGTTTSVLECYNGVLSFCPNVASRDPTGQPLVWLQPTMNLGRLDFKGLDVSANYKLPQFSFGQFNVGLNATYMKQAKIDTAPGLPGNLALNGVGVLGTFGSPLGTSCPNPLGGLCFFPRIRAVGTLNWQLGPLDAQWTMRYISKFKIGSADPSQYDTATAALPNYVIRYGATVYNNLQVGYNIQPLNTRLDVGVDNVFDKQPPFLYANNTLNANTDPEDFDVLGRYYWARVTVNF